MADDLLLPTTELEAVNLILFSIGESDVPTLDDVTNADAAKALLLLRHTNRVVQRKGWHFNTDEERLFTRNVDGNLLLPANTLRVDTAGTSKDIDAVERDGKLWDRKKHTFVFEQDLYLDIVLLQKFESTPQVARDMITEAAGLQFQAGQVASELLHKFTQERITECGAELRRTDTKTQQPNALRDSYHGSRFQAGRVQRPLR